MALVLFFLVLLYVGIFFSYVILTYNPELVCQLFGRHMVCTIVYVQHKLLFDVTDNVYNHYENLAVGMRDTIIVTLLTTTTHTTHMQHNSRWKYMPPCVRHTR